MKHVVKESEPRLFAEWKGCANENWRPSWENLGGEPKKALKDSLIAEQGSICCYCERRLEENPLCHNRSRLNRGVKEV